MMMLASMFLLQVCIEIGEGVVIQIEPPEFSRILDGFFHITFFNSYYIFLFNEVHIFPTAHHMYENCCSMCFGEFNNPVNLCKASHYIFYNDCITDWSKHSFQHSCPLYRGTMIQKLPTNFSECKRLYCSRTHLQKFLMTGALSMALMSACLFIVDSYNL